MTLGTRTAPERDEQLSIADEMPQHQVGPLLRGGERGRIDAA